MFQSHLFAAICLKLLFSIVTVSSVCSKDETNYFDDTRLNKYKEEARCYQSSVATEIRAHNDSCLDASNIELKLNNITGKLDVNFKIRSNIVQYNFMLKVGNVGNEQDCGTNTLFTETHSEIKFNSSTCNQTGICKDKCKDTETVSFNFVYTDCYKLDVGLTFSPGDGCGCFSTEAFFYYTKYNKTTPALGYYSNINKSYNRKMKQLTLTSVRDSDDWQETTITLFFVNETTVWALVLRPTKEIVTIMLSNTTNNSIACMKTNNDDVACSLSNVIDSKMTICHITLGTATRCKQLTTWASYYDKYEMPCSNRDDNYTPQAEDEQVVQSSYTNNSISAELATLIGIIVIGFVLSLAFIVRWLWNKRVINPPGRTSDALPLLSSKHHQQLLLLYARDCPPFMDLMKSFRQILENYAHFEVYDCYDESRHWEEKSVNPSSWMLRLVADQSVKIIVISSKCAYMRQQALSLNRTIRYAEPNANDLLFLPALQYLNETLTQNDYKKVFVVRFDGFSDDRVLFTHINEYTRFALPKHFHELINCLQESAISISNDAIEPDSLNALQILQLYLTRLTKYVNQNESYLNTLLFETDSVV